MRTKDKHAARFFSYVDKTSECWLWKRSTSHGYGQFYIGKKRCIAHRFSWELNRGAIPDGLFVLHHCDNPPCVNPKHLFLGTQADNIHDMMDKGRMRSYFHVANGEKNPKAKLTKIQVNKIRALRGVHFQKDIAAMFGVTRKTISRIQCMESWT